jgi:hypothetical protein
MRLPLKAPGVSPTSPRVAAVLARRFPAQHLKAAPNVTRAAMLRAARLRTLPRQISGFEY